MRKIYENSSCKVFPGFYESILFNSDTLYHFEYGNLPEGFCWEFKKGGYQSFVKQTCENWVSAMTQNFKDNPLNIQIGKYHSIWSPREYNFKTDKIRFDVKFNLNELKKFCWKERRADFNNYLQKTWSSRSGFISFVPNNVVRFEYDYKNNDSKYKDNKDMLIDIMLEWYFLEYINFNDVVVETIKEDFIRISENVTLQSEEDRSLWDYEYDDKTNTYIPTHKLEVA